MQALQEVSGSCELRLMGDHDQVWSGTVRGQLVEIGMSHQIRWNTLREHNRGVPSAHIMFIYYDTYIVHYLIMLQGCVHTDAYTIPKLHTFWLHWAEINRNFNFNVFLTIWRFLVQSPFVLAVLNGRWLQNISLTLCHKPLWTSNWSIQILKNSQYLHITSTSTSSSFLMINLGLCSQLISIKNPTLLRLWKLWEVCLDSARQNHQMVVLWCWWEFKSSAVKSWLNSLGTAPETSMPYQHQQNGCAECIIHTVGLCNLTHCWWLCNMEKDP